MKYNLRQIIKVLNQAKNNQRQLINKKRLSKTLNASLPIKLNIGAGGTNYEGWHSLEIDQLNLLNKSDWSILFKEESISNILAEHVWEHLSLKEARIANRNCFKFLKAGGRIRLAVPDGFFPDEDYINYVKPGGYGLGSDDHKVLYDYKLLNNELQSAGFKVELLEYWDENGNFHFKEWKSEDGHVNRSQRFDRRNENAQLKYTSLIIDGIKP